MFSFHHKYFDLL